MKEFSLSGKTAFVTGAGRGLGKAMALALAEAGADIVALSRTVGEIEQTASEARAMGRKAIALPTDVTQVDQVERAAAKALEAFGKVDILVNNAGNLLFKPLVPLPGYNPPGIEALPQFKERTSDDDWSGVLNAHLNSSFYAIRALAPQMLQRRAGRIINITSASPDRIGRFNSAYDTAKGALMTMTRSLAVEWARYNVTVNSIAPGHFLTPMAAPMHEHPRGREWMLGRIPMRRTGDPREVGILAVYLSCDAASYVTGQVIFIDGGETL